MHDRAGAAGAAIGGLAAAKRALPLAAVGQAVNALADKGKARLKARQIVGKIVFRRKALPGPQVVG